MSGSSPLWLSSQQLMRAESLPLSQSGPPLALCFENEPAWPGGGVRPIKPASLETTYSFLLLLFPSSPLWSSLVGSATKKVVNLGPFTVAEPGYHFT